MTGGGGILYLGDQDVRACGCSAHDIRSAVERAFRDQLQGRAWTARELSMPDDRGNKYAGKGGGLADPGYACIKWYGYFARNPEHGLANFHALIVLNEGEHGRPVAVMSGAWISEVRTAAMTAIAARYMARPDAARIGFIGCGAQARSHLQALHPLFPLKEAVAYSRTLASAEKFAGEAEALGLRARAVADPRDAVRDCDIVVSCVPRLTPGNGFLDAAWASPGCFIGGMDLGFSWRRDSLAVLDRVVTDDLQAVAAGETLKLNYDGPFAGGLAELVGGKLAGRRDARERNAIIFAGSGLADVAAAVAVYQAALAKGIGTVLPA